MRDGVAAGAAAQRGRSLQLVGAGRGIEVPGAQLGQDGVDQVLALLGIALTALDQLVAARRLEGARGLAPVLLGLVAQVGDHDAARRTRDKRMRCISMLPEEMVAETE